MITDETAAGALPFLERWTLRRRARLIAALRERVRFTSATRVLDLGGGVGVIAGAYAHGAAEVVVLEPDAARVAQGRRERPHLRFVAAGAERIPFPDDRFEAAVAMMSWHHFRDPDRALSEALRVVVPGGVLVVVDVERGSRRARWMEFVEGRLRGHRHRFTSEAEVAERAGAAGWERRETHRFGDYFLLVLRRPGPREGGPAPARNGFTDGPGRTAVPVAGDRPCPIRTFAR